MRRPHESAQYTSIGFAAALATRNMLGSMGTTGICRDNAAAESFFASLKKELVHRTAVPTHARARTAIAEYSAVFYNLQRINSSLDYRARPGRGRSPHKPASSLKA